MEISEKAPSLQGKRNRLQGEEKPVAREGENLAYPGNRKQRHTVTLTGKEGVAILQFQDCEEQTDKYLEEPR